MTHARLVGCDSSISHSNITEGAYDRDVVEAAARYMLQLAS